MTREYDITDIFDRIDKEKYAWLKKTLNSEQFVITDGGFLISSFTVSFTDPKAETLYLLRWSQ